MWKKYDDEFKRNALQKLFDAERGQIGRRRVATDSKGTTAAPNLPAEGKLEECAPRKIIIGDITYIRL